MLDLWRKKAILLSFAILVSFVFLFCTNSSEINRQMCYRSRAHSSSIRYFDDILLAQKQPTPGKSIFFHETSCSTNGVAKLNAKQACAIESAALRNPNRDIFVLFASPVGLHHSGSLPQFFDILQQYPNIHFRNIDLWRYSIDTPVFKWIMSGKMFESSFLFPHMSDILRAITLYRYGGFYMDLDVIVQKSVDDLGEDFVGDDWADVVNGAVLHLNNYGIGRRVTEEFLRDLMKNFDGQNFIANGPRILTRVCENICGTQNRTLWTPDRCSGLRLQPKERLYPVEWANFMLYFDPKRLDEALTVTQNATLIHVWNDMSRDIWNKIGTNNAYQVIAEQHCPFVYSKSKYL